MTTKRMLWWAVAGTLGLTLMALSDEPQATVVPHYSFAELLQHSTLLNQLRCRTTKPLCNSHVTAPVT